MLRVILFVSFVFFLAPITQAAEKIAMLGDSNTAGFGLGEDERSWPKLLGNWMEGKATVSAHGHIGGTILNSDFASYASSPAFVDAAVQAPHKVVVALGTNDSKEKYADDVHRLEEDLNALLKAFQGAEIVMCTPPPAFQNDVGIRPGVVTGIARRLRSWAAEREIRVIDFHEKLNSPALFFDGVHLNARGHDEAARVARAVLDPSHQMWRTAKFVLAAFFGIGIGIWFSRRSIRARKG